MPTRDTSLVAELFTVLPPADALALLLAHTTPLERGETVALGMASGRLLISDLIAPETIPAFDRAMMDGFAVRSLDTLGASDTAPGYLQLAGEALMGRTDGPPVLAGTAVRIHTGGMLPAGADAVIMVEDTALTGSVVEIVASVAAGENVLIAGDDVRAGTAAIPRNRRLDPAMLGGLAALGQCTVVVRAQPRIAIVSTGDELVPVDATPHLGQVRDVNAVVIADIVRRAGGVALPYGIVPDDAASLTAALRAALEDADALVVSAGSSVSHRDITAAAIAALGAPGILAHGIAIRPGKPTIVAAADGKPIVGLPGNPASALVVARRIVAPLVARLGGLTVDPHDDGEGVEARASVSVRSRSGREDYVPVTLARDAAGERIATPIFGESNAIFPLVRSDGWMAIPLDRTGIAAGERVRVVLR